MLSMMGGAGGAKFGGLGGGLGGDYNLPSDEDSDDEEMPELDDIESETVVIIFFYFLTNCNQIELFLIYLLLYRAKVKRRPKKPCPT